MKYVKCLNNDGRHDLTINEIYVVIQEEKDFVGSLCYTVKNFNNQIFKNALRRRFIDVTRNFKMKKLLE